MQQLQKKTGLLEPARLRAAANTQPVFLKTFLGTFWNSFFHDRLLEMREIVTPYVDNHKYTQVANK